MVQMSVVVVRVVASMMSPGSERRRGNHQEEQGCRKNRLHAFESSTKPPLSPPKAIPRFQTKHGPLPNHSEQGAAPPSTDLIYIYPV